MSASKGIRFFAVVASGKRSFQLKQDDLNEKRISLMSTLSSFCIVDTQTKEEFSPNSEGTFDNQFDPLHEYQVLPKKEISVSDGDGFVSVGSLEDIQNIPNKRKRVAIHGRDITIMLYRSDNIQKISAIDSVCYHLGGPLIEGDIEEIGSHMCIICPWHRYKLDLETGEAIITGSDTEDGICSKGFKQRVHEIKIENGNVAVKLKESKEEAASDHYAYMGLYKYPTSKTPPKLHSNKQAVTDNNNNSTHK